jgi:hypothetical protein
MGKRLKKFSDCELGHHKWFLTMGGFETCQMCGIHNVQEKDDESPLPSGFIGLEEWLIRFHKTTHECSKTAVPFTAKHIVSMIQDTDDIPSDTEELLEALSRTGIIRKTGKTIDGLVEWVGHEI